MGHVQINLFGSFHVERDGKSVDEQLARSPKGMLLMQYLILAPRQTAEAKTLMQVMWPEENSTSPDTALKTLISRQRALLREISPELAMCLVTVRGGYRWVCPPEVSVDVLEFEEMLARMKLPGGATPSEEMLTRMLVLYQGRLLADQQPQPAWLYNRSERLHQQFLQTVDSRLAQLQQAGYVHRYVALVRRAIDADPTNEALQQRLIEGLRQTERDTDADQQVELAARLNSAARDEMMADYYDRIQRANRALETGLVQFKEELMRGEDNNRAIVCDRRVFRSLFCLQRRGMERTGGHALLGILTLTELDPASEKREAALNGLVKIMLLNLRRGDVITRLDESTIAMFLPNADESAANIIIDRLKRERAPGAQLFPLPGEKRKAEFIFARHAILRHRNRHPEYARLARKNPEAVAVLETVQEIRVEPRRRPQKIRFLIVRGKADRNRIDRPYPGVERSVEHNPVPARLPGQDDLEGVHFPLRRDIPFDDRKHRRTGIVKNLLKRGRYLALHRLSSRIGCLNIDANRGIANGQGKIFYGFFGIGASSGTFSASGFTMITRSGSVSRRRCLCSGEKPPFDQMTTAAMQQS